MSRVLIVDDRTEEIHRLRALLQGHGWDVVESRHDAEAPPLDKDRETLIRQLEAKTQQLGEVSGKIAGQAYQADQQAPRGARRVDGFSEASKASARGGDLLMTRIRSRRDRERRSSFHTTTTSPLRSCSSMRCNSGRSHRAPEAFSSKTFDTPASLSARVCKRVSSSSLFDTRA